MSRDEEESVGFTVAEKFLALLIILIGAILLYYTTSTPDLTYPIFFAVGGLGLIGLGIFLILAKAQ